MTAKKIFYHNLHLFLTIYDREEFGIFQKKICPNAPQARLICFTKKPESNAFNDRESKSNFFFHKRRQVKPNLSLKS